jgi:hypothetical protein
VSGVATWVRSSPPAADQAAPLEAVSPPEKPERGLAARAFSIGFWSAGLSVTLAALAVPGLIVLLLLPLLGFWYLVFCVIAAGGDK